MKIDKSDVIWNYIGMGLRYGINIIILPLILNYLTEDEIGLWYLFVSIGGIATLLDFGFAPTLARNIAYIWSGATELQAEEVNYIRGKKAPNLYLLNVILKTCRLIYLSISLIAFVVLVSIGSFYVYYMIREYDFKSYFIISWIIYVLGTFLNLYYGYFTSFLKGVGAIAEQNKAVLVSKIVQLIISYFLLVMGGRLIAVCSAYLISGVSLRMISKYYFYRHENIGQRIREVKKKVSISVSVNYFKIIWHNAWKDGLVSFSTYIMTQINTLLCSYYLTLTETGVYGVSLQLIMLITSFAQAMYGTYQPVLQEAHICKDVIKSRRIMSMAVTVYTVIYILGLLGVSTVGIPIIHMIKPTYQINICVLLTMGIYSFLYYNHSLFASYISNTNRVPYMKAYLISAVLTIAMDILLLEYTSFGIWALLISPIIINLLYNNWKWPSLVLADLEIRLIDLYKIGFVELKKQTIGIAIKKKRKKDGN